MMRQWNRWLVMGTIIFGLTAGLGAGAGCGDDDSSGNNNNVQADAGVDAATGDTVRFKAVEMDTESATYVPVAGVLVAFDAPDGERTEVTTGADGLATFEGVDWSQGDAAVTMYLEGYALVSAVNLDETSYNDSLDESQSVPVPLQPLQAPAPDSVTLSGSATGMDDPTRQLVVNTPAILDAVANSEFHGTGTQTWSVDVPTGEPFILQAIEGEYTALSSGQGYNAPIYQVMQMEYGPVSADETDIELDFDAYGMTTYTADVSVTMPTRTDSPIRTGGIPYCFVCASNSAYCHGWPTYEDVVDNHNRIDLSFLWVDPDYVEDTYWFCRVTGDNGEVALSKYEGKPTQDQVETLIDAPTWVTPADPTVAHDITEPLEWTFYEDVNVTYISFAANNIARWIIYAGPNATTATVPEPPTGVSYSTALGAHPVAKLVGGTFVNGAWERVATSQPAAFAL